MSYLKMSLVAIVAVTALTMVGAGAASAETVVCTEKAAKCTSGNADGVGTEIKIGNVGISKVTTTFKNIECSEASITAKITSAGEKVSATVEGLNFGSCNCEVKVLKKGTLELKYIVGTDNATFTWSGTEVTTNCNTIIGTVHCVYETGSGTDFGTLVGGNPAKLELNEANLPRQSTSAACAEQAHWDASYEVTSPKPLYIEPEVVVEETVLCTEAASSCPVSKTDGVGTEIKVSLVSGAKSKLTTFYNNIECGKSSITAKVTSTGKTIGASVESLSFEECNCEVNVLKTGTLGLVHIAGTANATVTSTGTEITTSCGTVFGVVHCIYTTSATDLGALEGGNPAKMNVGGAELLRPATNTHCAEGAKWDAEYEVTSPKPLYLEPGSINKAVLCTEKATPCPGAKADGVGTEIKASLVSGTKSKLTTPYNNIECGKSSLTAKVTSTGEKIGASVEGVTFEECNCEVKVLAKGTLELEHIASTDNATVKSTGTEITTSCGTIFGNVHCIYTTSATDLGTLEGGNPARLKTAESSIPHPATNTHCAEGAKWDVEYEVTSPKPLYIEPE